MCQKSDASDFPIDETHGIALWPEHRLLVDSRGLGWRDVYTSLAIEDAWRTMLPASPHICLAYCQHGGAAVRRRMEGDSGWISRDLRPRLFGVVPEGRDSDWDLRGRPSIQLIYLRRSLFAQLAVEAFGLDDARLRVEPGLAFADPMLEQLALELLACARDGGDRLYVDHLGRLFGLRVLRRHVGRDVPGVGRQPEILAPRMRRVMDLIDAALEEDLGLDRLAREAGVGAHAFAAAFRRALGVSPHRYVLERRIERAKTLLRDRETPLAEIALQCGFSSQSHLTTTFRRLVGQTPKAFRQG